MTIQHSIATGVSLIALGIFLLITSHARGQTPPGDQTVYVTPVIPTEEAKIAALKLAYKINGNSMVGHNEMIDLTKPIPVTTVKVPVTEVMKAMPVVKATDKNELDEAADLNMDDLRKFSRRANMKIDICARHGMHKVAVGSSWRCRK
jgi:hypothetical protein